jgi:hypothetical protein
VAGFYAALQSALDERLGSRNVSIVDELPLTGDRGRALVSLGPADPGREAVVRVAGSAYFDVMRIPILAGRPLERRDDAGAPRRMVVSESLARSLFGFESAIGRQVRIAAFARPVEIVGVVGDVRHRALDESLVPTVYLSPWQAPSPSSHVVARSARADTDVVAILREEVARLDGGLPVYARLAMADIVAASPGVPMRRVLTATFMGFALLAVVLGAIGLFGVVAHDVARRRGELALRLALGAAPLRIVRQTLGQGAWMVGAGLAAGGVLSIWAGRLFDAVLIAGERFDPWIAGLAAAVLVVAGVCAVLPAALRAGRTDPLMALRAE